MVHKVSHISHSQAEMFMRCPAQWYFRYILGMKVPPSGPLHFGITFDEGLSENYTQKITTEKDLSKNDVTDIFLDKFDGGRDKVDWKAEKPEDFREPGIELVGEHMKTYAPSIMPKSVQEKIEVKPDGFDFNIMTVTDLVTKSSDIVDWKTTGRSPSKNKITKAYELSESHLRQGSIYNYTYRIKYEIDAYALKFLYHVRKKSPVIIPVEVIVTPDLESFAVQQLFRVRKAIESCEKSETFLPNRGHMMCSEKMCGYWKECHGKFGPTLQIDNKPTAEAVAE